MPINILMPALSPTMTEGKLAKWTKKEGDKIKAGDVIAEIETDKATMEVEAVDEGVLAKIIISAGAENVAVNSLIAILLEEGEELSALSTAPTATPELKSDTKEQSKDDGGAKPSSLLAVQKNSPHTSNSQRIFASPLAKRLAKEKGVDLNTLKGSGPHGRIIKVDVEKSPVAQTGSMSHKSALPAASAIDAKALADAYQIPYHLSPNSGVRKVIAKRLLESKQTVPHYYLTIDCTLDDLMKLREQINEQADGYKLSVNDFIIKATALALKKVPDANSSWQEDATLFYDRQDISVAVATDNGLITPIIKNASQKSLKEISVEMKDLGARARAGKLKPEEFQGGTASISNLGMMGVKQFQAIINPPQSLILAIGTSDKRAVVENDQIVIRQQMTVTGSFDHRTIDGAIGANFLKAFKEAIENPIGLLL